MNAIHIKFIVDKGGMLSRRDEDVETARVSTYICKKKGHREEDVEDGRRSDLFKILRG
jgi:hypothetical protein